MGREVGKIVEVKGTSVKAELFELLPPYLVKGRNVTVAPRINTYVKTRVGLDIIICQITGEYYDEKSRGGFSGYFLELTVRGYFDGDKFVQGLRLLPIVAAGIELMSTDDIKRIYSYDEEYSLQIGYDLYDPSQPVYLNCNDIIPSHIGIFGNTGSGKSNTLTKILHEYSKVLTSVQNAKLLLFDLNNEYGGDAICNEENKTIYKLSTRTINGINKIPFNLDELNEDNWCVLLNATEATQRPVIKTAFNDARDKSDYLNLLKSMILNGQYSLIKSIRYNLNSYVNNLDHFVWHNSREEFYYEDSNLDRTYISQHGIDDKLKEIDIQIPENLLDKFLFKLYFAVAIHIGYGTQFEFISPLLRRAEKLLNDFKKLFDFNNNNIFDHNNIVIIQLADVNKDMMEIVPAILTDYIFHMQVNNKSDGRVNNIINIVVDEAHNLLYEDELYSKHTMITTETFEKAIKEGRKFGLYLWIASQRPSDISSTIVSQMHNYFIHKLVNPYDLNRIRKAVAFLDERSMDALTVLGPGEFILSGTGVKIPQFAVTSQVDYVYRPNSENVVLFGLNGIFNEDKDN